MVTWVRNCWCYQKTFWSQNWILGDENFMASWASICRHTKYGSLVASGTSGARRARRLEFSWWSFSILLRKVLQKFQNKWRMIARTYLTWKSTKIQSVIGYFEGREVNGRDAVDKPQPDTKSSRQHQLSLESENFFSHCFLIFLPIFWMLCLLTSLPSQPLKTHALDRLRMSESADIADLICPR